MFPSRALKSTSCGSRLLCHIARRSLQTDSNIGQRQAAGGRAAAAVAAKAGKLLNYSVICLCQTKYIMYTGNGKSFVVLLKLSSSTIYSECRSFLHWKKKWSHACHELEET